MIKPLTSEELGILFQEIEFEPTGKLSELAKVAGLNLAVDYVGVDLSGENLSEDDLAGVNFSGSNLSNVNFKNTKLTNSNLSMAILIDANLQGADLSGSDLSYANLSGVNFIATKLKGANFCGSNLSDANLVGVDFKEADFSGANFSGTTFSLDITENFYTKDPRVYVCLNVAVNAKIANLIEIKDYLSQEMGIKDLMEKSITSIVSQYLNQVEPDRFYTRFFQCNKKMNEKKSVEQELKEVIKEALEKSFFVQVSSVVPFPLKTQMIKSLEELCRKTGNFSCSVDSIKGLIMITIKGHFAVQGVEKDSWYTFQSRKPDHKMIQDSIETCLQAHLLYTYGISLQYVDNESRKKTGEGIEKILKDNIIDQYGLEISMYGVEINIIKKSKEKPRKDLKGQYYLLEQMTKEIFAPFEESERNFKLGESIRAQVNEATESRLSELLKMRKTLALTGSNEEEIKNIERKIYNIENMASSSIPKAIEKFMELETLDSIVILI
jgi:uncharacterized protein YjbI with pentapeptide repeats/predicted transcriptional regulator